MTKSTTRIALIAAAVALFPVATQASARAPKPTTIKLPASSLKDPAARLCMPKSVMRDAPADTPNTVCQTQAEWTAAGVNIVAR